MTALVSSQLTSSPSDTSSVSRPISSMMNDAVAVPSDIDCRSLSADASSAAETPGWVSLTNDSPLIENVTSTETSKLAGANGGSAGGGDGGGSEGGGVTGGGGEGGGGEGGGCGGERGGGGPPGGGGE